MSTTPPTPEPCSSRVGLASGQERSCDHYDNTVCVCQDYCCIDAMTSTYAVSDITLTMTRQLAKEWGVKTFDEARGEFADD